MGTCVGAAVGASVGLVGCTVGAAVGCLVVGANDVGAVVGACVGVPHTLGPHVVPVHSQHATELEVHCASEIPEQGVQKPGPKPVTHPHLANRGSNCGGTNMVWKSTRVCRGDSAAKEMIPTGQTVDDAITINATNTTTLREFSGHAWPCDYHYS